MSIGTDHRRRAAENEALFREVNEQLMERKQDDSGWSLPSLWVCECAEETCTERIEMSPLQYEELRSEPTHFALVPNEEHRRIYFGEHISPAETPERSHRS